MHACMHVCVCVCVCVHMCLLMVNDLTVLKKMKRVTSSNDVIVRVIRVPDLIARFNFNISGT